MGCVSLVILWHTRLYDRDVSIWGVVSRKVFATSFRFGESVRFTVNSFVSFRYYVSFQDSLAFTNSWASQQLCLNIKPSALFFLRKIQGKWAHPLSYVCAFL